MITPDGDRVIMPKQFVDELKNLPRETISFFKATEDVSLSLDFEHFEPNYVLADTFGQVHWGR